MEAAGAAAEAAAVAERPQRAEHPTYSQVMSPRTSISVGATLAALAVALGAFGVHALSGTVTEARLATFETGVRYLMYHGFGLVLVGLARPASRLVAPVMLAGSLVFSLSLFLLVLTDTAWLGAVAPVGGALMIAGWLKFAYSTYRTRRT